MERTLIFNRLRTFRKTMEYQQHPSIHFRVVALVIVLFQGRDERWESLTID
jgi:hypothetical protein